VEKEGLVGKTRGITELFLYFTMRPNGSGRKREEERPKEQNNKRSGHAVEQEGLARSGTRREGVSNSGKKEECARLGSKAD
jgi:hypothetical protein